MSISWCYIITITPRSITNLSNSYWVSKVHSNPRVAWSQRIVISKRIVVKDHFFFISFQVGIGSISTYNFTIKPAVRFLSRKNTIPPYCCTFHPTNSNANNDKVFAMYPEILRLNVPLSWELYRGL